MKLSPAVVCNSAGPVSYGCHDHSECQRLLPTSDADARTSGSVERTATFTVGPPTPEHESSSASSISTCPPSSSGQLRIETQPANHYNSSSSTSSCRLNPATSLIARSQFDHDRAASPSSDQGCNPLVTDDHHAATVDQHGHALQVPHHLTSSSCSSSSAYHPSHSNAARIGNSHSLSNFAMQSVDNQRLMNRPTAINVNLLRGSGTNSGSCSSATLLMTNGTSATSSSSRLQPNHSHPHHLQGQPHTSLPYMPGRATGDPTQRTHSFSPKSSLRRRCVAKNGSANVRHAKISRKSQRYFLDTFTTMVDIEWRFNLLVFALSFIGSWLLFACIWWAIAFHHGDLILPDGVASPVSAFSMPVSVSISSTSSHAPPPSASSSSSSITQPPNPIESIVTSQQFVHLLATLNRQPIDQSDTTTATTSVLHKRSSSLQSITEQSQSGFSNATQNANSTLPAEELLHLAQLILARRQFASITTPVSPDPATTAATSSPSQSTVASESTSSTSEHRPCLSNIHSFSDALLFSIETQHTIGYGTRQPTDECPEVIVLLMLQAIAGCLIQCFVVGFVFAKLSRPQRRNQTLVFSKRAVINLADSSGESFEDDRQLQCTAPEIVEAMRLVCTGQLRLQDLPYNDSEFDWNNPIMQQHCHPNRNAAHHTISGSPMTIRATIDYSGDRRYRLQFRLGDVRDKSHIVNARVNAFLLSKDECAFKRDLWPSRSNRFGNRSNNRAKTTTVLPDDGAASALNPHGTLSEPARIQLSRLLKEKRLHNFNQRKLRLTVDSAGPQEDADGELLLLWPLVVSHEIDCHSPFWNWSAKQLQNGRFEIVIILEGTIESTGQPIQARTSYLPSEISWGERFVPMLQSETHSAEFSVNFAAFHLTRPQSTPIFSAQEYMLRRKLFRLNRFRNAINGSESGGSYRRSSVISDHNQRRAAILQLILSAPDREQLRPDLLTNVLTTLHVPTNGDGLLDASTLTEVDLLLDLLTCTATLINRAATNTEFFAEQVWAAATALGAPYPHSQPPPTVASQPLLSNGWSNSNSAQLSVSSSTTLGNQFTAGRSSSQRNPFGPGSGLNRLLHLFNPQSQSTSVQSPPPASVDGNTISARLPAESSSNGYLTASSRYNGSKFLVNRVEPSTHKSEHRLMDCDRLQQL